MALAKTSHTYLFTAHFIIVIRYPKFLQICKALYFVDNYNDNDDDYDGNEDDNTI